MAPDDVCVNNTNVQPSGKEVEGDKEVLLVGTVEKMSQANTVVINEPMGHPKLAKHDKSRVKHVDRYEFWQG